MKSSGADFPDELKRLRGAFAQGRRHAVRARFEKPGVFVVGGAFAGDRFLLLGNSGGELSIWSLK
jgi:hypothetical protein